MNKKLLAIAIGAVAALPLSAHAGGPTLYGKLNVTLESAAIEFGADTYPTTPAAAQVTAGDEVLQLNSNASRIGIKGDFGLDVGELKALYQAEYEIDVDSGAAAPFSQRNIFGGLQGGFGTLRYGKFDDPIKASEGKIDQFNDLAGDMDSFVSGQNRPADIIEYATPKMADAITLRIASILAEGANVDLDAGAANGETSLFDTPHLSVAYDKNGVYAALAYGSNTATATQTADTITRADIVRLVAQFKMDAFEVGGLYQMTTDVTANSTKEDTSMMISAGFTMGEGKIKAQYGMTEGDASGDELVMTGIGYDHKLAKASKAMVYMTTLEKTAAAVSTENSVFGVGVEHNF